MSPQCDNYSPESSSELLFLVLSVSFSKSFLDAGYVAPVETAVAVTAGHDPQALSGHSSRHLPLSGLLCAGLGAVAFSGKAVIVKLMYRYEGVDAIMMLALRMLVALPFFLVVALFIQRRPGLAPLGKGDPWKIILLGFTGYYLSSYLDFLGLQYITATLERLILYLSPTMVLMISVFVFRRHVTGRQVVALLVSYAGVMLAFAHDFMAEGKIGGSNVVLGSALVLVSTISYACYLFGSGELVKRIGALRLTAWASIVACLFCIAQFLLMRPMPEWNVILQLPMPVYGLSLLNGTVCTVLPMFLVMLGISRLGAAIAAQIGMIGPISTIILSTIFLGESIGPWQIAGTVLVVTGVFIVSKKS